MEKEIYVIMAENDKPVRMGDKIFNDDGGPLIFEQYSRSADIESIKKRAKCLSKRYGNCRIARLEFVDGLVYDEK